MHFFLSLSLENDGKHIEKRIKLDAKEFKQFLMAKTSMDCVRQL